MTGVPLSEIKGCLVEKNECNLHRKAPQTKIEGCNCYEVSIENATVDLQGSVRLTLNREKLAKTIYTYHQKKSYGMNATPWEKIGGHVEIKQFYEYADAIIANQKDLFEVVKEGT